ncbi:MAG: hypothetical protein CMH57_15275 [Myxococcales bacterium]|nr:hypothetical protein [Myxococcales bacterium]
MSAVNARLSKLRGLLHEGPTRWTLICDLLVSWPAHDGLDVALEYAELHAQRWPADVRKAPARWWHELGLGRVTPAWSLIRALKLPLSGVSVHEGLERLPLLADVARFQRAAIHGWVELTGEEWETFTRSPTFERLERLELVRVHTPHALVGSPALTTLTHLTLSDCGVGPDLGRGLLQSTMGPLQALDLSQNRTLSGAWVAEALAPCDRLAGLRELSLESVRVGSRGLAALAQSPHLERLERLNLRSCGVTDDAAAGRGVTRSLSGVEALAASPLLTHVMDLDLAENDLGEGGAVALARGGGLARLERLNLRRNGVTAEGMKALARSPLLARIKQLDLRGNHVGPEGAEALASLPEATLEELDLSFNEIEDRGVAALAESPAMTRLVRLYLYRNHLLEAGARALARSSRLANLEVLQLGFNAVGDGGAAALARSETLGRLISLGLAQNQIGTPGAMALAATPLTQRLEKLDVHQNRIGPDGLKALADALKARPELTHTLPQPQLTWEEEEAPRWEGEEPVEDEQRAEMLRGLLQRLIGEE